jgi:histone H3/H4
MTELPLAALERMIRKSGAKRVSKDATVEYARMLEGYVSSIAKEAALLASHSNRNTVLEKDVLLAVKRKR